MTLPFCQLRILVAENDALSRSMMVASLEAVGMAVVVAGSGTEALARFTNDNFDLIFMELDLPRMDGFAATTAIRMQETSLYEHVPIVAMTRLRSNSERDQCLAAGMDSYMEKPANSSQVQTALLAFTHPDSLQPAAPPPKWNRRKALQRVGGDESLLGDLIAIFGREKSKLLRQMEEALLRGKPHLLRQAADALQEKLNYLGASEVSETARKLGASGTNFLKAAETVTLLRFQLAATDAAMRKN